MTSEYIDFRIAVTSGGSHKVTIPKRIVDEKWNAASEPSIPIIFYIDDAGKVFLKPLKESPDEPSSADLDKITEQVGDGWLEWYSRQMVRKMKELESDYINDKISEAVYTTTLARYERKKMDILKKLRAVRAKGRRGDMDSARRFFSVDMSDFSEFEFLISEMEKDERFTEIVEEIKALKSEEVELRKLLKTLEERTEKGQINRRIGSDSKIRLEKELTETSRRLNRLKETVANLL